MYLFFRLYSKSHLPTKGETEITKKFNTYLDHISANKRDEQIKKLKENLDLTSKEEIDNILFRYKILQKNNIETLSSQEILEQKEWKKLKTQKYKKYTKLNQYAPQVFYGISGLKWLPEKQKKTLNKGTFLDIGAYDGDSALSFYYNFFPKKIYAFEPEFNNFKILEKNSKKLNNNIIIPIKEAVSNEVIEGNISNEFAGSKLQNDHNLEKIKINTIDNFVSNNKIENVDLIKMDTEGEETNALLGARETIIKYKPILAISIYHNPKDFFEIKPWLQEIVPEYNFIIRKANPFSPILELMLIAYTDQ